MEIYVVLKTVRNKAKCLPSKKTVLCIHQVELTWLQAEVLEPR